MTDTYGYGLWALVVLNSALFIFFAWTFYKPVCARGWRTFGLFPRSLLRSLRRWFPADHLSALRMAHVPLSSD